MNDDTDTGNGGDSLTIDEAAAAYVKANPPEVPTDQTEEQSTEDGTTDDELPEGEETDGETEGTDQAEEGEDVPESEQGRFVADNAKVKLPDGTVTTIAELKQGSLRQADYTRKTQEAAEVRKTAEAQSSAFKQRETQLAEREAYAATLIQSIIPKPPDPSMTDPNSPNFDIVGYSQQRANFEAWQQHLSGLSQRQQQFIKDRQAETQQSAKDKAATEWTALTEKMPELKDEAKAKPFFEKLMAHAKTGYGFTEDDVRSLLPTDHRFALMARDAIKWRELQASKPKVQQKVEGRPPVQKGGKRLSPSESKARQASEAMTRLGQTGRLDDAVAALLATQK